MDQDFFSRVVAEAYIAVANAAASIVCSNGRVERVTRNGAGDVSVFLHAPGEPTLTQKGGILLVTAVNNIFAAPVVTLASATEIRVRTFDAAGVALDSSFCLSVKTVTRPGGVPA